MLINNCLCISTDCSPLPQAELSCEKDTLTVKWPTDLTLNGTITRIPEKLKQRLTQRLLRESKHPILSIVISNRSPVSSSYEN